MKEMAIIWIFVLPDFALSLLHTGRRSYIMYIFQVCLLPTPLLTDMVTVVLWLLECSHQSGSMHAVMFLSNALTFKVFLEIFDQLDGLRKLFNVVSDVSFTLLFHLSVSQPSVFITTARSYTWIGLSERMP